MILEAFPKETCLLKNEDCCMQACLLFPCISLSSFVLALALLLHLFASVFDVAF
jgi:hypothetical protein